MGRPFLFGGLRARVCRWPPLRLVRLSCERRRAAALSGPEEDQRGSLIELARNGAKRLTLADASSRAYLEDGDRVTISASAAGPNGAVIRFGEFPATILPAR